MRWLTDIRLQIITIFPDDSEMGFDFYGRIGVRDWVYVSSFDTNLFIYKDGITSPFESDREWI